MARHRLPARHRATPRAPTSSSRSPLTATSRSRRRSRHRSAACISRTRFHCYNTSNRYRSRSSTIRSSSSLSPSLAGVEFFSSVPRANHRHGRVKSIHRLRARATPERARRTVIRRSTARIRSSGGIVVVSLRVRAASTHGSRVRWLSRQTVRAGRARRGAGDARSGIEALRNAVRSTENYTISLHDRSSASEASIDRSLRRATRWGGVSAQSKPRWVTALRPRRTHDCAAASYSAGIRDQ